MQETQQNGGCADPGLVVYGLQTRAASDSGLKCAIGIPSKQYYVPGMMEVWGWEGRAGKPPRKQWQQQHVGGAARIRCPVYGGERHGARPERAFDTAKTCAGFQYFILYLTECYVHIYYSAV